MNCPGPLSASSVRTEQDSRPQRSFTCCRMSPAIIGSQSLSGDKCIDLNSVESMSTVATGPSQTNLRCPRVGHRDIVSAGRMNPRDSSYGG